MAHLAIVVSPVFEAQRDTIMLPSLEIAGFAYENFLKVMLVKDRVKESDFAYGKNGHDLLKLLQLSEQAGRNYDHLNLRNYVAFISEYHSNYSLRYTSEHITYRHPHPEPLQENLTALQNFTQQFVDYPPLLED